MLKTMSDHFLKQRSFHPLPLLLWFLILLRDKERRQSNQRNLWGKSCTWVVGVPIKRNFGNIEGSRILHIEWVPQLMPKKLYPTPSSTIPKKLMSDEKKRKAEESMGTLLFLSAYGVQILRTKNGNKISNIQNHRKIWCHWYMYFCMKLESRVLKC